MATEDKSGFQKVTTSSADRDDDAEWIDRPAEGESVQGIVLEVQRNAGKYNSTLVKLKRTDDDDGAVNLMWCNQTIDDALETADVNSGDEILVEGVDSYTFTNDDGDDLEATDHEVYVR